MNKLILITLFVCSLLLFANCTNKKTNETSKSNLDENSISKDSNINLVSNKTLSFTEFLPKEFVIFDTIYGELNNDKFTDCILIIKGTDKTKIEDDEYKGKLDKNRRGIIILFNKNGHYELSAKNYNCFSSENEDGGIYFPPELNVEILKNKLYISYAHGRYGFWKYTFRFHDSDFELIGYDDNECRGPIIENQISINYLSKKKQIKETTNLDEIEESGDEVFEERWEEIKLKKLIRLSEIKDFDELYRPE